VKKIIDFILSVVNQLTTRKRSHESTEHKTDASHFSSISKTVKTLSSAQISESEFFLVEYKNVLYYALFKCPCGCGQLISLPLNASESDNWEVSTSNNNRPTVYPSIRQVNGCYSHFWINDGKIRWCRDTGLSEEFWEYEYQL
jgi:hypothetical protein